MRQTHMHVLFLLQKVVKRTDVACYLSQKYHPLAIGPNDVIHLRTHSLPGQLRGPKTCLWETRISVALMIFFFNDSLTVGAAVAQEVEQ